MKEKDLFRASKLGRLQDMKNLLAEGVDINIKDSSEATPLYYAVNRRDVKMVELLLSYEGIDVNIQDYHGDTPLHLAAKKGYVDIAELLLDKNADVNKANKEGEIVLHNALSTPYDKELIPLFINRGVDVNTQKEGDRSAAIHIAAWAGKVDIYKLLLEYGANPNMLTHKVEKYEDDEEIVINSYTAKEIYREFHPSKIKEFEAAEKEVEAERKAKEKICNEEKEEAVIDSRKRKSPANDEHGSKELSDNVILLPRDKRSWVERTGKKPKSEDKENVMISENRVSSISF